MISYRFVNVQGATRPLTKFENWVSFDINNLTREEAIEGSRFMVENMPKRTGAMRQAVSVNPKGNEWAIISRTPRGQGGKSRPYHVYYNYGATGGRRTPNKSGKTYYYERTVNHLGKSYPERVIKDLDRKLGI